MNRRDFLIGTAAALVTAPFVFDGSRASAQDLEFLAALERAQRDRPASFGSSSRIAPLSEPGDPLVVHGRAFAEDGKTPLAGVVVFAYHTDRTGVYSPRGSAPHTWRLKGWARTAADGTFEFRTIRPAPYPGRTVPAHIHVNIYMPDGSRYGADDLVFEDDPLVPPADRANAVRIRRDGTVQHVDYTCRAVRR
jgi:protocatechuate 3,4-dioxygenase, beta subunit